MSRCRWLRDLPSTLSLRRVPAASARPYPVMLRIMGASGCVRRGKAAPIPPTDNSPKNLCCQRVWANVRSTRVSCACTFPPVPRPRSRPPTEGYSMSPTSTPAPWSRRDFIKTAGLFGGAAAAGWPAGAWAQSPKPISASHSISTFVYGQHLVAAQKKFFEAEGLLTPDFVVPGGGAKVVQALAAGQVLFALGDSNHPLKITEKGKDALMIFATDTRCSYANIVVRKELWDRGVRTVEALADGKLVGRKAVVAATAIGSGTYVYGVYVLQNIKGGDGKPVNDHVEWVGGGASTTMLGGLKAGKFDAIMAVPEWQSAAVEEGVGKPLYDIQDEKAWNRVFGGPIPVTVGY